MAATFKDGRHHLYDFSDMGDLGVKSVIYYDAELNGTMELARSFLIPLNMNTFL